MSSYTKSRRSRLSCGRARTGADSSARGCTATKLPAAAAAEGGGGSGWRWNDEEKAVRNGDRLFE